jgi:hypothetical protein
VVDLVALLLILAFLGDSKAGWVAGGAALGATVYPATARRQSRFIEFVFYIVMITVATGISVYLIP